MEQEYLKLKLLQESKLNTNSSVESVASRTFPLHQNLKLVPKFNEHDPDVFFSLFECIAKIQGWLVDGLVGWLVDWLVGWLVGWLMGWLVDGWIGWLVGWWIGWLVDGLVGWWMGWLVGWLMG